MRSSNSFQVPEAVSRSGIIPENTTRPLRISVSLEDDSDKVNVYFHFAEIQSLAANDTREFDIEIEDNIIQSAYSPTLLQSDTKFNLSPQKCSLGLCYLDLVKLKDQLLHHLLMLLRHSKFWNSYMLKQIQTMVRTATISPLHN